MENSADRATAADPMLAGSGIMHALIHAHDWTTGPLGGIASWPACLKSAVGLMLSSPHPMWIAWGHDAILLYNDALIEVLGLARHPSALGRPAELAWREVWEQCGPATQGVLRTGEPSTLADVRMFSHRGDLVQEGFYSFACSALRDELGAIRGVFCPVTDVSAKNIGARRLATLDALAAGSHLAISAEAACTEAARVLAQNRDDLPFAILYLVHDHARTATVVQTAGLADLMPGALASPTVDLTSSTPGERWPIGEVVRTRSAQVVSLAQLSGMPSGPAQQALTQAVVVPLSTGGREGIAGVLIAGVNPAHRLEGDYRAFFALVAGQLATAIQYGRTHDAQRRREELHRGPAVRPPERSPLDEGLAPAVDEELRDARILLVEDHAQMRGYIARLLGGLTHVDAVATGEAALAALAAQSYDLVLTDIVMPGIDGIELLGRIRSDPRTQDLPVILLSGRAGEDARVDGLGAGADDYLVKPFSGRELIARVSLQIKLARTRQDRITLLAREQLARREAELQKEHLVMLFMQAPTPIAILRGSRHVIELANEHMCRAWRRAPAMVLDRPLFEAVPELIDDELKPRLDEVYATGRSYLGRAQRARPQPGDGAHGAIYYNVVYAPLRGVLGEVEGVLVIAFDVTEEVQAREHTGALRAAAEAASRAKDEFMAILGHELRNPLSPIMTTLQVMRLQGMDSPELDILERQAGHLIRLVDDLLDVSRITRGKVVLRRTHVELSELVARALEVTSPLLEQSGHRVIVGVPRRGMVVHVDADRMTQVIANLVTNAAKYSDARTQIEIMATRDGESIRLAVRDQGVGIEPEMLGRVFDIFVQQAQTLERSRGGMGLGLAIVKSLVELHGGTVAVVSDGVSKGSEFAVVLPAVTRDRASTPPPIATLAPISPERDERILIVDDNKDAARALETALRTLGFRVEIAHDGPEALVTAERFRPRVALLDIGLPAMDGYELAGRLRAQAPTAHPLHLVAITGYGQEEDRRRAIEAGFERHLVKPVNLEQLRAVIEGVCTADHRHASAYGDR